MASISRVFRQAERASALVTTLLMSAIIFVLAVCFSTMVTIETRTVQYNNYANTALYVADAGMQRGFVELTNLEPLRFNGLVLGTLPFCQLTDTAYIAGNQSGIYTAIICGATHPESTYRPQTADPAIPEGFGWVPLLPKDLSAPPNSRGRFRWRFTILARGGLMRDNTMVLARRSLIAKVLVSRAEDNDDYQGYGKIESWSEQNR